MSGIESLIPRSMYQSDFHHWKLEPRRKILPKAVKKSIERQKHRPIQMDLEIMQSFKPDVNVPFNLMHRKKRIIQENPHDSLPNVKLEENMFEIKLQARRERPPVYIVPQISLDKVPKEVMYGEKGNDGLISSLYSSDWKKASSFAVKNSPLKPESEPVKVTFEKKVLVDKSIESTRPTGGGMVLPMEIGLAKCIADWEKLNPVEFVDTTKLFWEKNSNRGLCSICDPLAAAKGLTDKVEADLETCLKEDALRTPYTLHPPGYTGYVPRLALGIQFRKNKFTKYDPFVTTLMQSQGVYK